MQDAASGKRQQQCDAETVFVGADELAVHLVHEYPRNVQPQTAAVLARGIRLSSVEFIRNQVDFILRHAHTAVCNLHLQKAVRLSSNRKPVRHHGHIHNTYTND